ncbi:MAG: 3-oxoacyl-[acyl-carrier-protein] synthase III C-terminal domain-containing protein [Acidobacteriota bacterium]
MTKASIAAVTTALPENYYQQEILAAALRRYCMAKQLDFELDDINSFFTNVRISGRYFTLPVDSIFDTPKWSETSRKIIELGLDLATQVVNQLLEKVQLAPDKISLLNLVTLAMVAPSIDAQLMNRIPFRRHLKRVPIIGWGCLGGTAGVARVADYLAGHPQEAAILITLDFSSACWQGSFQSDLVELSKQAKNSPAAYGDLISTLVSAALFGDGAGAVLMVGREHALAQKGLPQVIDSRANLVPNTQDLMGMKLIDSGVRNILRPEVADYASSSLKEVIEPLLAEHNLSLDKIGRWIVHPGGPKVIQAVEETFQLDSSALNLSRKILDQVGNVSSSTVIFMLEDLLLQEPPRSGTYGLLVGMGPGFSQEAVLLQW